MPNLYIIAGCNGAGKTTASYTVLPEILNCKEFVNADIIAAGISIRGVVNLFALYMPVCDEWMVFNNMDVNAELIAKSDSLGKEIYNTELWIRIEKQGHDKH